MEISYAAELGCTGYIQRCIVFWHFDMRSIRFTWLFDPERNIDRIALLRQCFINLFRVRKNFFVYLSQGDFYIKRMAIIIQFGRKTIKKDKIRPNTITTTNVSKLSL